MMHKEDIAARYVDAVKRGYTHMLVYCDTFDYSYYTAYVTGQEELDKYRNDPSYSMSNMQRLMECYALHKPMDEQTMQGRYCMDFSMPPKFAVGTRVHCTDNNADGEIIAIHDDGVIVVEYADLQGQPCHLYDPTDWNLSLYKLEEIEA